MYAVQPAYDGVRIPPLRHTILLLLTPDLTPNRVKLTGVAVNQLVAGSIGEARARFRAAPAARAG